MLTQSQRKKALQLRSLLKKRAAEAEAKGTTPKFVTTPSTLPEAVELVTPYRKHDAVAFAKELSGTDDALDKLMDEVKGQPDDVVNYLLASSSHAYFAKKYLGKEKFDKPFDPDYHRDLFNLTRMAETHSTDDPIVIAGPRESGKSTAFCCMLPIHCVVFPTIRFFADGSQLNLTKRYILFVSVVRGGGQLNMESVCKELESNEQISADFGNFYKDPDDLFNDRNRPWNRIAAVTTNGIRLEALGRKSKFRSISYQNNRPDLILGDDLQNDKEVESEKKREEDFNWIRTVIIPAMDSDRGNLVLVGNLLHPFDMMAKLLKHGERHGWHVRRYQLFTDDPKTGERTYLWKSRFNDDFITHKVSQIGKPAVEKEYQQRPEAGRTDIKLDDFKYYKMERIAPVLGRCVRYMGVDPSASENPRSDLFAIASIAFDPSSRITYVSPVGVNAVMSSKARVDKVIELAAVIDPKTIGIETNAQQLYFKEAVDDKASSIGITLPTRKIPQGNLMSKRMRIAERLFEAIADGRILFLENHPLHETLINQLVYILTADHDDLADALEICIRMKDEDILSGYRTSGVKATIVGPGRARPNRPHPRGAY